jgi:phosphatidate phosphatase APP1
MEKLIHYVDATVKVYHGYGHQDNLIIYGHVLRGKSQSPRKFTDNIFANVVHLTRLFFVKPIPHARVMLQWGNQQIFSTTAVDGFFSFEWKSEININAGWHIVKVYLLDSEGIKTKSGVGKVFIPNSTQYGFISDIDDTVLVSHSNTTGKKLRTMFTKNPRSRKTFSDVVKFYKLLSLAATSPSLLNPFFYVSSSEWNLYDDLNEFFKHNGLPKGAFLLNKIKRWYQLLKIGKTNHEGKLIRVTRILEAFPKQIFVLLGDNSQRDPQIYFSIAKQYPNQIKAIYIRNIDSKKAFSTLNLFKTIDNKSIFTFQFKHTDEAIAHAKTIGLI